MNRLILPLLLTALLSCAQATKRPNIIFFLSDDQRADFLGCAGHPFLQTPTIDRMAENGVRFSNAFVTTSICSTSRATILTGLWERSHRYTFGVPPMSEGLAQQSYPYLLRRQGYHTGFIGKYGVSFANKPEKEMFDSFQPLNRNLFWKKQKDGSLRHLTDIVGDRAIDYVRANKDKPFCLSVSFNAAHAEDGKRASAFDHYPWPPMENGLYEDVIVPEPAVGRDHWKKLPQFFHNSMHRTRYEWRDTPEKYQSYAKAYFRMITGLDRNIGRVWDELEKLGIEDNTVIIFTGDNGYFLGSRGFSGKWNHYEESLRVPLVVYDPRLQKDKRGKIVEKFALNVDIPATIMALAQNGEQPTEYQGRSLLPLIEGKAVTWRTDFFAEHLFHRFDIPKWEGVRTDRYKYARYFENLPAGEFLFDLHLDPLELNNLAKDPTSGLLLRVMRERTDNLRDELGGVYSREKWQARENAFGKPKNK